ncbi:MAG TPA: hypothetical protein VH092_38390 [Urbifossiella sp.]|jgi:hypothetical protein|nr:hypothetical protein [Urbifossiella sp.]
MNETNVSVDGKPRQNRFDITSAAQWAALVREATATRDAWENGVADAHSELRAARERLRHAQADLDYLLAIDVPPDKPGRKLRKK